MPDVQSDFWVMTYPQGWCLEQEDTVYACYDPEGPGTLQLSSLASEAEVDTAMLRHLAAEHLQRGAHSETVDCGDFQGLAFDYDDGEQYWREWYLRHGSVILFVTYSCPLAHEGEEDVSVDAILETLRVD